ncbi:MmgE/PrpD family protein [Streptomyces sp. NPDC001508]|uniref:MmgE/PrpD family protein n=1 Tax=Streptomyces sp. NPDC001508 TaxID=3154656 RepID=UPI00332B7BA6
MEGHTKRRNIAAPARTRMVIEPTLQGFYPRRDDHQANMLMRRSERAGSPHTPKEREIMEASPTPNLDAIVDFTTRLTYDDIPERVALQAARLLMDTVGCMFGGAQTDLGRRVVDALAPLSGRDDATIVGTRHKADPVTAAFVNAVLSDALDYEDTLRAHPSAAAIPAALAIAQARRIDGRRLIAAVVAGYEVGVRVADAIQSSAEQARLVPSKFSWMAFTSAATAVNIAGLDAEKARHAFGYASSGSPLPVWISKSSRPLNDIKNNFGEQARAGVLALHMAESGVRTPVGTLDSEFGFWRMVGSDRYQPEKLVKNLGVDWRIEDSYFKGYPACLYLHSMLDGLTELRDRYSLLPEDIAEVKVGSFREMAEWFGDPQPVSIVDAEFSAPYTAAMVLTRRQPGPDWYSSSAMNDSTVRSLAARVTLHEDSRMEALWLDRQSYGSRIQLRTTDGREFSVAKEDCRGGKNNPIGDDELARKFLTLTTPLLGAVGAESLRSRLLKAAELTRVPDLSSTGEPEFGTQ